MVDLSDGHVIYAPGRCSIRGNPTLLIVIGLPLHGGGSYFLCTAVATASLAWRSVLLPVGGPLLLPCFSRCTSFLCCSCCWRNCRQSQCGVESVGTEFPVLVLACSLLLPPAPPPPSSQFPGCPPLPTTHPGLYKVRCI